MAPETSLRVGNKNFLSHHELPYFRDNIQSQTDAKVPNETSDPRPEGGSLNPHVRTCLSMGLRLQFFPIPLAAALPAARLALKSC